MVHTLVNADMVTSQSMEICTRINKKCATCWNFQDSFGIPKATLPKATAPNQIVTWVLKELGNGKGYILWMVCSFSRSIKGTEIKDKTADSVIKAMYYNWCMTIGFLSNGFWSDNGGD